MICKGKNKVVALYQDTCVRKDPKTLQMLIDEKGDPKIFGDSYGEVKVVRLKEAVIAPDWVFEVPQAVRNPEIVKFFSKLPILVKAKMGI